MTGYTRQSSISNGDVGDASLWNAEYDALEAAFAAATGHDHDGTTANGKKVSAISVIYDPVASGLTATDVQAAVDEIEALLDTTEAVASAALPKAGGAMTGNLTTDSLIDGRDVSVDGTKLDGIESGAKGDQNAAEVTYDPTASGMAATDIQAAVDEVDVRVDAIEDTIITGPVQSIDGVFGIVALSDINLDLVDNTTDADKPVSTATQTALDAKAASVHTHTKSEVGLGNVDNTADADKPISTATQTALDGKQVSGTYNTIIGTDSDLNTSGSTILDSISVTDGVILSMGTRVLTPADIGAQPNRFDTVAAMKASTAISIDDVVETLGHQAKGEGGDGSYFARAVTGASDDDGSIIKSVGVPAIEFVALFLLGVVNTDQFGSTEGSDATAAFNNAIDFVSASGGGIVRCGRGKTYDIEDGGIILKSNVVLDLNGSTLQKTGTSVTGHVVANFESQATNQSTITAITQADQALVSTSLAHGRSVGDWVYVHGVVGMTELNFEPYEIGTVPTTTSFTLLNVSSVNFTAYVSGGTAIVLDHDLGVINGKIIGTGTSQGVGGDLGHGFQCFKTVNTILRDVQIDDTNGDNMNARLAFNYYVHDVLTGRFGRNQFSPTSGTFYINNLIQEKNKGPLPLAVPGVFIDCEPDDTDQERCKIIMDGVVTRDFTAVDFNTLAGGDFGIEVQMTNCKIGLGSPNCITIRSTNITNAKNVSIGPTNKLIIGGSSSNGVRVQNVNDVKIDKPTIEGKSTIGDVAVFIVGTVERLFYDAAGVIDCDWDLRSELVTDALNNSDIVNSKGSFFITGSDNNFHDCDLVGKTVTISQAASTGNSFDVSNKLPAIGFVNGAIEINQDIQGIKRDYTPVFTNLTEVGGSATIVGRYIQIGKKVFVTIEITPVTSTSATTSTVVNFPSAVDTEMPCTVSIVSSANLDIGTGRVDAATNRAVMQPWTAVTATIIMSITYVTSS